jgi:hypothetical protein
MWTLLKQKRAAWCDVDMYIAKDCGFASRILQCSSRAGRNGSSSKSWAIGMGEASAIGYIRRKCRGARCAGESGSGRHLRFLACQDVQSMTARNSTRLELSRQAVHHVATTPTTMVLLTITPAIVRAITEAQKTAEDEFTKLQKPSEPTLAEAAVGNPISHSQLIDLSTLLKAHAADITADLEDEPLSIRLDTLLRGSTFYIPPPPPKKEPTSEYKALMARLRHEEEARQYSLMLNPPAPSETFAQRFPVSPLAYKNSTAADFDDDELSYEEVHRQIILIINVLISIICVSVFIWVAARHWSPAKRLGLSMGGSGAIAIAEVVVYSGYVRKVREAKAIEKKKPEIKEIIQSWVIDGAAKDMSSGSLAIGSKEMIDDGFRYRKGKHR